MPVHKFSLLLIVASVFLALSSCKKDTPKLLSSDPTMTVDETAGISWNDIVTSGEFIVGTISGPDTYFDYNGQASGKQYMLLSNFARNHGLRIRVEIMHSLHELCTQLQDNTIDLAMFPISVDTISHYDLLTAGNANDTCAWAVRPNNKDLKKELDTWYANLTKDTFSQIEKAATAITRPRVTRKVRSPYLSREKGIISIYDQQFKKAAQSIGWDWRLIASQCYQESGFDPNAVSSAGARGLMQIMPMTAKHLGLSRIEDPNENIAAAARYLAEINQNFSQIRDAQERVRFVLASYNGGIGHIRDAQALAKKNGQNPNTWAGIRPYILGLQESRFYLDPVVRNGYMIGSQTVDYVESILIRFQQYGGHVSVSKSVESYTPSPVPPKNSRYRKETHILKPVLPSSSSADN
ncbi:MAG: transglycosylase SLT domain-containing protein [Alloprevotella sp.]|nr:transglycosylase SLT domain-containing protein [Alloprevotella sp.]